MTTMIEKIARAIADNIEAQGATLAEISGDDVTMVDGDLSFKLIARAAVEAMREPTEAMLAETHELVIGFGGDDGTYNIHCEDWQAKDVWMTMIDVALKEGQ